MSRGMGLDCVQPEYFAFFETGRHIPMSFPTCSDVIHANNELCRRKACFRAISGVSYANSAVASCVLIVNNYQIHRKNPYVGPSR